MSCVSLVIFLCCSVSFVVVTATEWNSYPEQGSGHSGWCLYWNADTRAWEKSETLLIKARGIWWSLKMKYVWNSQNQNESLVHRPIWKCFQNSDPLKFLCPLVQESKAGVFFIVPWLIISPVSEGSGDVMVLRQSRPPPATRRPQWC